MQLRPRLVRRGCGAGRDLWPSRRTRSAQPPQGAVARRAAAAARASRPIAPGSRGTRAANQPLAAGTASVSGTVVVAGTGQPARRARVTLNATEGGGSRTATTDEEGRYAFDQLAAGRYNVSASKSGHVGVTYGQARPGRPGTPIQLTDGQKFAANLQLPRGSVITGTVVDEYGEATRRHPGAGAALRDAGGPANAAAVRQRHHRRSRDLPRLRAPAGRLHRLGGAAERRAGGRRRRACRPSSPRCASASPRRRRMPPTSRASSRPAPSMLQGQLPQAEEQATGYAPVYFPGTVSATPGRDRRAESRRGAGQRRLSAGARAAGAHRGHGRELDRPGHRQRADHADRRGAVGARGRHDGSHGPTRTAASASPTFPRAAIA